MCFFTIASALPLQTILFTTTSKAKASTSFKGRLDSFLPEHFMTYPGQSTGPRAGGSAFQPVDRIVFSSANERVLQTSVGRCRSFCHLTTK
jgi:hypothetical protein